MSADPLLEVEHLAVQAGDRTLAADLSFRVQAGECWVVLGPNGAGKSTLIATLAGLRPADGGHVRLLGRALAAWPRRALAQQRAWLAQLAAENLAERVRDAVAQGRHPHLPRWGGYAAEDDAAIAEAMIRFELMPLAERAVTTLSGGERQRVALATTHAQQARLILLDEPINHLDLAHQRQVQRWIEALKRAGDAVIVAVHDLNWATAIADAAVLLDGTGQSWAGPADETLTAPNLSRAFGCALEAIEAHGRRWFWPR